MDTYQSSRVVAAPVTRVRTAVDALMSSVWAGRTRLLAEDAGHGATYAVTGIPGETEGDVWLTWRFSPEGDGTRVTVVLDELDSGPDATEELDLILDLLLPLIVRPHV